nr:MAG TPA: hypothetical protein [Caudoviricetes sp.]
MSIWRNSFYSSSYTKYIIYLLWRLSEKTGSLFFYYYYFNEKRGGGSIEIKCKAEGFL